MLYKVYNYFNLLTNTYNTCSFGTVLQTFRFETGVFLSNIKHLINLESLYEIGYVVCV